MFNTEDQFLQRERTPRNQPFFLLFFGTGVLLNAISLILRVPNVHHGTWYWLGLAGPILMLIGVAFNVADYVARRRRAAHTAQLS